MSTLRVSNIEAKADASSPTVDEKVKITNSQGRVLMQVDGKTSGITTVGINTTGNTFTVDVNNGVTFSGIVTATGGFSGNVTGNLTGNINATGVSTIATLNVTQSNPTNLNVSGVTTTATLRATSIVGVTTAGITTAYIGAVNDGPISGARNRIINGDMRIDQRNAGASVTPTTLTFSVDRWGGAEQTDGSMTLQRSGVVPVGFTSSLVCTITSADSSLAATQYALVRQGIEGYNIADLNWGTGNASPVTLSFWVRSSLSAPATYSGYVQNNDQNRSYPFTYTINSQNTWEYKTITIPGDTTGTWLTDNSGGIFVGFSMGTGSTYSGTAGSWASTNYLAATGGTSVIGTNGATWYLTGVQLEPGAVATPFERRSYGQELALCKRYYEKGYFNPTTFADQYGNATWQGFFEVEKRATGTLSYDDGQGNTSRIARWFTNAYATNIQPTGLNTDTTKSFLGYIGSLSAGTLVKVGYFWYQNSEL